MYLSRGGSLSHSTSQRRGGRGSSGLRHVEMKGEPRVRALRGRGVSLFEVRCARGSLSIGERQGRKVEEENEGFAGTGVLTK